METGESFRNGYWIWDDAIDSLAFVSNELGPRAVSLLATATTQVKISQQRPFDVRFRDTPDTLEKIIYRRYFRRKCKPYEVEVVTIQDVKDVALFLANPKDITVDFVAFFHIPAVDRFLRAMILYFQMYLDVWERNLFKRVEAGRKLRQPIVTNLENVVRDDLSDLRSMLSREYLCVITGMDEANTFHHMKDKNNYSLSEKDRMYYELLLCMSGKVVWIALQRRYLSLIEYEISRLFRSDSFDILTHHRQIPSLAKTDQEIRVLAGAYNYPGRKLLQKSPLTKDLIFGEHDYRLLGIGVRDFEPSSERIKYLEAAYSAPEEMLVDLRVPVGLLGLPREEYDPVLLPREKTSKTFAKLSTMQPSFVLPTRVFARGDQVPKTFSTKPCKYSETLQTVHARKTQLKLWKRHIKRAWEGTTYASAIDTRTPLRSTSMLINKVAETPGTVTKSEPCLANTVCKPKN